MRLLVQLLGLGKEDLDRAKIRISGISFLRGKTTYNGQNTALSLLADSRADVFEVCPIGRSCRCYASKSA